MGVSQSGKEELRRELNIALLSGLGIGSVIGSGVYALPGLIASVSGPSSILAVVLMGLITLVLMYIFAKLAKLYPKAGALYYFAKEALGDMPGFITGFSYYVSCFVGVAAIIYAFLLYLSYYVPGVTIGLTLTPLGIIIALTILAIVTAINIVGVKHGATLNLVLTILKIIPLIVFITVALMRINVANFEPFAPFGFSGIGLAIAFGFWMFVGFESIVLVSEEVREPEKTIMRAAVITIAIVTAVYTLVMLGFIGSINWAGLGLQEKDWSSLSNLSSPLADVGKALGLPWLPPLMVLGAIVSTAGAFSAWILLQARVAFALAREGRFWEKLSHIHLRFGTPSTALVSSSLLTALVIVLIPSFANVILVSMITEFIPYAVSSLSLAVVEKRVRSMVLGFVGMYTSSLYIYWACWPWTLTGAVIAIASLILYKLYAKNVSVVQELRKSLWYITYLVGLTLISLLGDSTFVYNNFLPISPLNILKTPSDAIAIAIFTAIIFTWAFKAISKTTAQK